MSEIEVLLALLVIVLALGVVASRIGIAYPILLVVAGLALAVIPIWPEIALAPEIVFIVFLPPILFSAAYNTSWRDFRQQFGPISFLAIGLVLVTMAAVAMAAKMVIPGMSWGAAFVLGAIVSPTDAVATVGIVQRIGVPRRIVTVLEGESLVNDATSLVSYRFAVAAVVTGTFSLWEAGFDFVIDVAGGLIVGYVIGRVAVWAIPYLNDEAGVVATFIAAIAAYIAGETLTFSGVLATVMTGLIVGRYLPSIGRPQMRLQMRATWDLVVFVINGLVFLLIGLQLQPIVESITLWSNLQLIWFSIVISLAAIVIRIIWVFAAAFGLQWLAPRFRRIGTVPSTAEAAAVAWAGLRGVITLATALALPELTAAGQPFVERHLIIFLAFAVIVVTLLGQGLTLGPLVQRLNLGSDQSIEQEEQLARRQAINAALAKLDLLSNEDWVPASAADALRSHYQRRLDRLPGADAEVQADSPAADFDAQLRLTEELMQAEREALIALRDRGDISDEVLHEMSRELDLAASRGYL